MLSLSQTPFQQLEDLLLALTTEEYRRPLPLLSGSSIGQHVRHVLEFYQCVERGAAAGRVNYDARARDLTLEEQPRRAVEAIHHLTRHLGCLRDEYAFVLTGGFEVPVPTTAARELLYCLEHAVHHLAIIRIGVRHYFPHVRLDESFGVAASTLRYRAAQRRAS
ncbi:MAG: DinB family protein [Catalinimonas sp.]